MVRAQPQAQAVGLGSIERPVQDQPAGADREIGQQRPVLDEVVGELGGDRQRDRLDDVACGLEQRRGVFDGCPSGSGKGGLGPKPA